jgi:hypothetical protein
MMRGASGDECGKLLVQEYNRPAEAGVLKKPREATLTLTLVNVLHSGITKCLTRSNCEALRSAVYTVQRMILMLKCGMAIRRKEYQE